MFRHELARRAVEDSHLASGRIELNRLVLAALPDDAVAARRVHHASEAGDARAIVAYAPLAAAQAAEVGSHREAAAHYALLEPHLQALPPADRGRILADWAREAWLLDENELAVDLIKTALGLRNEVDDPVWLSESLFLASSIVWLRGDRREAEAAIDEAVALLADTPHQKRYAFAVSKQGQLVMLANQFDSAIEISDRALELAAALNDRRTMAHSLINKGVAVSETDFDLGMELLAQGQSLAAEVDLGYEEARAALNAAWLMVSGRRLDAADVAWRTALDIAFRHEIPSIERYAEATGAWYLEQRGDWVAAEDMARDLLASALPSVPTDITALTVLGTIEARRSRPEARSTLMQAWDLAAAIEEIQRMAPVAAALAEYAYLSRDHDEALLETLMGVLERSQGTRVWFTGPIRYWLWRIGIDTPPAPTPDPIRSSLEGDVDAAAAAWAEIGSPYVRADALSQGDTAQRLEALRIFEGLGAVAAARPLRKDLRDQGVATPRGPSAATRSHGAGLTTRQSEVLSLLAEGLSNAAIADRLFLSIRTIENHVAAVISKLDATNRDDAVEAAWRQGHLPAGEKLS